MKKMCILIFALMSSVVGFAQLLEVKGVETKLVIYDGSEYEVRTFSRGYRSSTTSTKWFGYSFYNMNSIPVSVEARLYENYRYDGPRIITTKTFNLEPGEAYIWKHENMYTPFQVNSDSYGDWTDSKIEPLSVDMYHSGNSYYVEYKAYKIL